MSALPSHASPSIESLYVGHHQWLRRWLHGKLGDKHCAEDLAHDTFMRLLNRDEALVPQEPRALLTTIATRVLSNHWRRKQIEAAWLETLAALPQPQQPSPEQQYLLLETLMEIDQLLEGLPVIVKRTFLMAQLDGLSQAQIAEQLQVSVTTVKRYLVRAAQQCYFADLDFTRDGRGT